MGISRTIGIFSRLFLPKVKDLMVKDFVTLDINKSINDAYELVMKDNVHCVIIVSDTKPIGILTRRDLISRCCFKERADTEKMSVREVMSHPLITIGSNENVLKAYELIMKKGIRRLIVIEDEKLVGDIRMEDIKHLASKTPITAFYRVGYFLMGMMTTIVIFVLILAL